WPRTGIWKSRSAAAISTTAYPYRSLQNVRRTYRSAPGSTRTSSWRPSSSPYGGTCHLVDGP
ncbi:MAG: hypothetical protein AVDCRST_MAG19-1398, partial [uncultured Thermomicrobiales bacterium]